MAAWITIFCKQSLAGAIPEQVQKRLKLAVSKGHIKSLAGAIPEQVQKCVDAADWWTLAEGYGIDDEDVVNAALDHFRIEPFPTDLAEVHRVYYRSKGLRQIDIWRWIEPQQVAEQVAEELDGLKRARRAGIKEVRAHLARVKEIISIELGWGQLEGMPVVLAYEIARWLAHVAQGWVKDHEDQWWTLTRKGFYKQVTSS